MSQDYLSEYKEKLQIMVNIVEHLISERPQIAAKIVGSTTIGNHKVEAKALLAKGEEKPTNFK